MRTAVGVLVTSPVADQVIVPVTPVISMFCMAAISRSQHSSADMSAVMPASLMAAYSV